ncbi:hypothetical protein BT96DRAFT_932340 [Gymnopus androsaceus JB14]|uniref:Uncharacterized protein n=1 Tax=Gymnopus androsaceus JB14 TaxID=1447944 RepID=A0A6A4IH97_9AGAR|nr:hypothetical protein BT96DRAFT_932340 [Gymnopus androsaceus JB14]
MGGIHILEREKRGQESAEERNWRRQGVHSHPGKREEESRVSRRERLERLKRAWGALTSWREKRGVKSQQDEETGERMGSTHQLEREREERTRVSRRERLESAWGALTVWRDREEGSRVSMREILERAWGHSPTGERERERRGQVSAGGRDWRGHGGTYQLERDRREVKNQHEGETGEGMGRGEGYSHPGEREEGQRVSRRDRLDKAWQALTSWRQREERSRSQQEGGAGNAWGVLTYWREGRGEKSQPEGGLEKMQGALTSWRERRGAKSQQEEETGEVMGGTHQLEREKRGQESAGWRVERA